MKNTLTLLLLACLPLPAATITLGWNPSPEADIAGYWIYRGTNANQLVQAAFSPSNRVTVAALPGTNYFLVTAVSLTGLESEPSNMATWHQPYITVVLHLEAADSLTGPWQTVATITNTEPMLSPMRVYRGRAEVVQP